MKFIPHSYQDFAIRFIEDKESMMLLDMGLGPARL